MKKIAKAFTSVFILSAMASVMVFWWNWPVAVVVFLFAFFGFRSWQILNRPSLYTLSIHLTDENFTVFNPAASIFYLNTPVK